MLRGLLTKSEREELKSIEEADNSNARYTARKKAKDFSNYAKRSLKDILMLQNLLKIENQPTASILEENKWKEVSGNKKTGLYNKDFSEHREEYFQVLKSKIPKLTKWLTFEQRKEIAESIIGKEIEDERDKLEKVVHGASEEMKHEESPELGDLSEKLDDIESAISENISDTTKKAYKIGLSYEEREIYRTMEDMYRSRGENTIRSYNVFMAIANQNPTSYGEIAEIIVSDNKNTKLKEKVESSFDGHQKGGYSSKVSKYCDTLENKGLIKKNQGSWKITERGKKALEQLEVIR